MRTVLALVVIAAAYALTGCSPSNGPSKTGAGFFEKTMFCGYGTGQDAVVGCNDKDQR